VKQSKKPTNQSWFYILNPLSDCRIYKYHPQSLIQLVRILMMKLLGQTLWSRFTSLFLHMCYVYKFRIVIVLSFIFKKTQITTTWVFFQRKIKVKNGLNCEPTHAWKLSISYPQTTKYIRFGLSMSHPPNNIYSSYIEYLCSQRHIGPSPTLNWISACRLQPFHVLLQLPTPAYVQYSIIVFKIEMSLFSS
jgi:hypothetical protein